MQELALPMILLMKNNYLGGAISPGLNLRYESLHNFTAKLPLLQDWNPKI
jgi:type III pantothenate kinase